eukprot:RCo018399
MATVTNSLGRVLPCFVPGYGPVRPFQGAFAVLEQETPSARLPPTRPLPRTSGRLPSKRVGSLAEALSLAGIHDGSTLSFHHHLREGDQVVGLALKAARELQVTGLTLAPTALFEVHGTVLAEHLRDGVVHQIQGSMNG